MKANQPGLLKSFLMRFTAESYPFPPGSQNKDGFERNHDNPLRDVFALSDEAAMRLSAFQACVKLLAETISTLPINFYEKMPDGTRRLANTLDLHSLLNRQPNIDSTAVMFWEAYIASMLMRGDGYAEKKYRGAGESRRLVALDFLIRKRLNITTNADGSKTYRYTDKDGTQRVIPEDRIFHTAGFTLDGQCGISAIKYGASVLFSATAADTAANNSFWRGLLPTVYFKFPKVLKKDQRDEARGAIRKISGALNSGEPAILEADMDVGTIGINAKEAQLLESRGWSVEEICRLFRIPPFMIGHAAQGQTNWGTGLEQQMIGFLTFVLRSWLKRLEQSINKNLLTPAERSRYYAEYALEGLLRADTAARAQFYASGLQNGYLNRDLVADLENLPRPPGGEIYTVQSNLLPLDQIGNAANPADNAAEAVKLWLGITQKGNEDASKT